VNFIRNIINGIKFLLAATGITLFALWVASIAKAV
jgi:hypothetical protein